MSSATQHAQQEVGGRVPDFCLPQVDGSGHCSLQDTLSGKAGAVIVFWSSICAHCRRYDSYFNCFRNLHPQIGLTAIASRYAETLQQLRNAVSERNLRFPILYDSSGLVARQWHAQQTPRCYLVNPAGQLLYRGAVDNFKFPEDEAYVPYLEPAMECFIGGRPIPRFETASFGCAIDTVYYRLPKQL